MSDQDGRVSQSSHSIGRSAIGLYAKFCQ